MTCLAGPNQSDSFPGQRLEHRPPFCNTCIVSTKIGNSSRDQGKLGLECKRQAPERTIDIKGRQRFAARMTRCNAADGRQKYLEFWLYFQDDIGPHSCQERRVTDELTGVA